MGCSKETDDVEEVETRTLCAESIVGCYKSLLDGAYAQRAKEDLINIQAILESASCLVLIFGICLFCMFFSLTWAFSVFQSFFGWIETCFFFY